MAVWHAVAWSALDSALGALQQSTLPGYAPRSRGSLPAHAALNWTSSCQPLPAKQAPSSSCWTMRGGSGTAWQTCRKRRAAAALLRGCRCGWEG